MSGRSHRRLCPSRSDDVASVGTRGGARRGKGRFDWFSVWKGRGVSWDPEEVAFLRGSRLFGVIEVSHAGAVEIRWRGRRMFYRLWQFTRKTQSPSLTERLELKRRAARLVRPEKGTGKGESGYCSPSRREGTRWSLYPKYRALEPQRALRVLG